MEHRITAVLITPVSAFPSLIFVVLKTGKINWAQPALLYPAS
jgi:hypothetical protein